jgi:molybdopterin converting factor subunit 1
MQVRVRFFARAREAYGAPRADLDLPPGATLQDCFRVLSAEVPALARMEGALLIARNEVYAEWEDPLQEGDEVALIPPVSGG